MRGAGCAAWKALGLEDFTGALQEGQGEEDGKRSHLVPKKRTLLERDCRRGCSPEEAGYSETAKP